ncbi:AMP-dependent synthetase/ligase [Streptomyces gobiensis]|uniref:AMP-dependent synthetase/ligase n=1 Tax=Streptomyces gobiensis TaxID=2875706 RepID=UPI001E5B3C6A|nr:AMP-dependent synthetase/ligase [Streptomyces gobiensis]UGY91311.1 AMP-dependent synthetase/ligase [Streptomyces gobiensis]
MAERRAPSVPAVRTPPGVPLPDAPVPDLVEPALRVIGGSVREVFSPPLAPPVDHGSLADIPFDNAAAAPGDAVFARKQPDGSWREVSCAEFAEEVLATARGLIASGLRPGERLGIMARTTYEWTLLDFAGWAAGLITVPIYPTSSAHQARWILQDAGVSAVVVENVEGARLVSGLRGGLPGLAHIWQLDNGAIAQLIDAGREIPDSWVTERRSALTPHAVATVIYTSGTTGSPKGCLITHGNFFAEVDNAIELLYPIFKAVSSEPASTLLFLPMSHVFGRMVAVGCQRARVKVGHAPSIETQELLSDLASFRPTFLLAIPYVLEKVYNTARATAESMRRGASFDRAAWIATRWGENWTDARGGNGKGPGIAVRAARGLYDPLVYRRIRSALGGRVRYMICGGSQLGKRLGAFYAGAGIEVFEGYGLTESTAAATVTSPLRPKLGTVGWPMPGTAVRIAEDGEILLKGRHIFGGYWDGQRQVTVPHTDADGWLPTGDIGSLDAEGYLTISGRKKDLIVTSQGKNLAPAPLEDWLRAHPLVSQALVIGDNRPYITALITLEPDGLAHWCRMHKKEGVPVEELVHDGDLRHNLQQAVSGANTLVSRAESIRRFVILPVDFTEASGHLTPSMKLKREAITQDFAAEIDALYR